MICRKSLKISKRWWESINRKRTDKYLQDEINDQHNSSPKSALSVIGVWLYELVQMSRTPFFLLWIKFVFYVVIPIQKQRNYFKHAELSVFSVLDLALYSKQLNNCHGSVIIQAKYDISMNQLFTVFFKDANISHIFQYYQIFIV